jgi:DNA-binding transcriptional ArsR family regulator
MVERLTRGPTSVSDLATPFDMTLSAIGQHIRLLESSGLVHTEKQGRVRLVSLKTNVLGAAEAWFASHRKRWEGRLDRLGQLLDETDD